MDTGVWRVTRQDEWEGKGRDGVGGSDRPGFYSKPKRG